MLARPDTVAYRAGKFVSRNRAIVMTAALSAAGLFASGLAVAWQAGVAESRRQEAKKRFTDLRHLATSFVTELDKELERLPGSTPARELRGGTTQADDIGAPHRSAPARRIECESEEAGRSRGSPRSGRGRGVRDEASSGRLRRLSG